MLERLLKETRDCYDELLVLHDTPDVQQVRGLVEGAGGRFFETPPAAHQEPHWPFAWQQASNDWVLRFDADEFPSEEMKAWLRAFRRSPEPAPGLSGYTCVWPLWNGRRMVTKKWPAGRFFLFHKQRVRFFGMSEQSPIPDGKVETVDCILCHQPRRKSYGMGNLLFRKKAHIWRVTLARDLLGKPADLPGWRWPPDADWPATWQAIRQRPLRTALYRLLIETLRCLRDQWRREKRFMPMAALSGPVYHAMLCVTYWRLRRRSAQKH